MSWMLVGLFLYKKVICFPTQLQWVTGTGMLLMEVRRDTLVLWGVGHGGGRSCYSTVGWGMEVVGGAMALSGSEAGWDRRDLC